MSAELLHHPSKDYAQLAPAEAVITDMSDRMKHDMRHFDLNDPGICTPEELGVMSEFSNGDQVKIAGMFNIGSLEDPRSAAIVDIYHPSTGKRDVFVGGLETDADGTLKLNNSWVELGAGNDQVTIGRSGDLDDDVIGSKQLWPKTDTFSDSVSRRHLVIHRNGNSIRLADQSTNGTYVSNSIETSHAEPEDEFGHMAIHTTSAEDMARMKGELKQGPNSTKELFANREVINRTTTDPEGMVDIRSWVGGGEAIVVDSKKDFEPYVELINMCETKLGAAYGEADIVKAVYETVSESMEYDLDFVNNFSNSLENDHRKVNLAVYLDEGKGVCRHMALATQWLGARMLEKHAGLAMFEGAAFTTPVNQRSRDNAAHEWARYTTANGEVYIIDPAQKFVGTLDDVARDHAKGVARWEYFADAEEKRAYEAKILGEIIIKDTVSGRAKRLFGRK